MIDITEELARKCLTVVDAGLVSGLGVPELGKMCVEAAINYALGSPHGDQPKCGAKDVVAQTLRRLKIRLNDAKWSSDQARTKGLRRLALAQLGSAGVLDEVEFAKRVVTLAIRVSVPEALRAAAKLAKGQHQVALLRAATACESDPTHANALEANAAADAAYAANAAYAAAAYAAADAAYAANAAYAAAAYAAYDAAYAAYDAYAAASAARAASAADAADAARSKAYGCMADKLLQLLSEAPMAERPGE